MVNYRDGKIYCLRSHQTDKVYVGSTTQILSKRKGEHKKDYKRWNNDKAHYISSFELCAYADMYIELIELYPCDIKSELSRREGEIIRDLNCVNKIISGRTRGEYYIDNKDKMDSVSTEYYKNNKDKINNRHAEYYQNNKDKISVQRAEYYQINKDKIKDRTTKNKQKVTCDCGSFVQIAGLYKHKRSTKHIKWLEK